jgi:ABC-type transporter MlaC component
MNDSTYMPTEDQIRAIARDEAQKTMASLAGLVLRRLQEEHLSRSPDRNAMEDTIDARLSEIFGEVLAQGGDV